MVSFWSSDPLYARHPLGFYLFGVTASAAVVGVFSHLRTMWAFYLGLGASKRLHGALLRRVLHAPVSFFDTTPVGRIIQRFSKDTDQVLAIFLPITCHFVRCCHYVFVVFHRLQRVLLCFCVSR